MILRLVLLISFFSANILAQNEFEKLTFAEGLIYLQLHPHILNSDEAGNYLIKSQQYHQEMNKACGLSKTFALRGRLFYNVGRVDSAGYYFLQSSREIKTCDAFDVYFLYNSWALLKEMTTEYNSAIEFLEKAETAAITLSDKSFMLNVFINKANVMNKQNKSAQAIAQLREVEHLSIVFKLSVQQQISLQNLGAIYLQNNKYDSAAFYFNHLLKLVEGGTQPDLEMDLYNNLGVVAERSGDFKKATANYKKAIDLASNYHMHQSLLIYLENYSSLLFDMGDYKNSREYLRQFVDLKDSLFNEEKFTILKELESKYALSLQNEKIYELENAALQGDLELSKSKIIRNTFLSALLISIVLLGALFGRFVYTRRAKSLIEKEKNRSDELLLNILPEEVATELKANGRYKPRDFDSVTVLFTDCKDFTSIAELLRPDELVAEMNTIFEGFDEIATQYNIEKIKTIGDAYMAASGLIDKNTDTALLAVHAGLDMLSFIEKRKAQRQIDGKPFFEVRVGLHTGPVIAGIVGQKKFQYDIWGDTVNTASRIESNGEVGQLNISHATFEKVKNNAHLHFVNRGKLPVKGKGELDMYFVSRKE